MCCSRGDFSPKCNILPLRYQLPVLHKLLNQSLLRNEWRHVGHGDITSGIAGTNVSLTTMPDTNTVFTFSTPSKKSTTPPCMWAADFTLP